MKMARKGNIYDLMRVMNNFAKGRASSVSVINNFIDFVFEDKKEIDIALHFLNEAVLHDDLRLFIKNFMKYELNKGKKNNPPAPYIHKV